MNVMTKRGSQDNVITYEHYCDTKDDLTAIPNDQITLGSTAVVLKDEGDDMGVYMANSSKEWIPFSSVGNAGGSSGGGSTGGIMVVKSTYDETTYARTLDHTWQEIYDEMENGKVVFVQEGYVLEEAGEYGINYSLLRSIDYVEGQYTITMSGVGGDRYYAESATDYPSTESGGGPV